MILIPAGAFLALVLLFRWAHRCWGKGLLSAVFSPLVLVPLGLLLYAILGVGLRFIAAILERVGLEAGTGWTGPIALAITILVAGFLVLRYALDQRAVSKVTSGPWLGVSYEAPKPRINQRRFRL